MKPAQILAYPWDFHDEGLERAVNTIAQVAGCNEVCLSFTYHLGTFFLPRNPIRRIYYGEHGAIYFQPDLRLYQEGKLNPRVSALVDGPDYLPAILRALGKKGVRSFAKIVYMYNHGLAREHPDCAKMDVLGNRYLAQLCPANPDVRAYALALTEDVVENFRPAGMRFEYLSYMRFDHGFLVPKVFAEITPRCRFLLSLCFCSHCRAQAQGAGMDSERFASRVEAYLLGQLDGSQSELDRSPVDAEWLGSAFGGELARFLEVRRGVVGSLYRAAVEVARSRGPIELQDLIPSDENVSGLRMKLLAAWLDRLRISASLPGDKKEEEQREFVARYRRSLPEEKHLAAFIDPSEARSEEEVVGSVRAASEAGADGFDFNYYGVLNSEHLEWIGAARHHWA